MVEPRFRMHPPSGPSISRRVSRRGLAAVLVAQLALAPCLAFASDATAEQLKASADAAMDAGAFAAAIASYRASYERNPNPALLYNIGSAYERLGDYPSALSTLERFALVAPPDLRARVPELDELIESIRARLARLVVRCSVPDARVFVRGGWQGRTPLAADLLVMPGTARVEVAADGYQPFAREFSLVAGRETRVDAFLVPALAFREAPRESERASSRPITTQWWFWTGAGVVLVGATTAVVLALTREKSAPSGDITPGRVAAPLMSW